MGNLFYPDFQDFLKALNSAEVDYILVGGYAVIIHGYHRSTGDMDIWVDVTIENYKRIQKAFLIFDMPMFDLTETKFLTDQETDVYSFGTSPISIDLMTKVKGLSFPNAFSNSRVHIFDDIPLHVLSREDLITAKKAANRKKDQNDIEQLSK